VINFHFPPSPKLFVHRCGRAARQGRIGFAFSIIDPEEFAYMADVHTFIGKEISNGYPEMENGGTLSIQQQSSSTYTLSTMTPSMIHTGIFPPDILAEEADSLNAMIAESMELQILWRISENGMKQYRRTRPAATRTGIKITKKVSKLDSVKYIHPLIAGIDPKRCSQEALDKALFIKHLQTFRPAQTVFESGIGTGVSSGGSKTGAKRNSEESYGVQIMRALRKEVGSALERNRKNITSETLLHDINRGNESESDEEIEGRPDDQDECEDGIEVDEYHIEEDQPTQQRQQTEVETPVEKRRMSKADRKKRKKSGGSAPPSQSGAAAQGHGDEDVFIEDTDDHQKKNNQSFVDSRYYMKYGTEDEVATYVEDSLQPQSGLRSHETTSVRMLENAMLDLTPDDALEMNKKKKMLRWDSKKRKFVKVTRDFTEDVTSILSLPAIFGRNGTIKDWCEENSDRKWCCALQINQTTGLVTQILWSEHSPH
jgi:ATP-dependent RNA helicase DDX54/DBP10